MARYLFVSLMLLATELFGQQNFKEKLVGEWTTFLAAGDSGAFHFNSDGSMYIKTSNGTLGKGQIKLQDGRMVNSLMRYNLNTNTTPMQIDFYFAFDNYFNVVGKSEGIVEFLDDNLIRIAMNNNRPQPIRPKKFDNPIETSVLSKYGAVIEIVNCDKFKNGNYRITDPFMGTTKITRQNDLQIETTELGDKIKCKVEWISDCTYTLTPLEFFVNQKWIADTTKVVQTVQILKTYKKSYIFSAGTNTSTIRFTREMFKED